MDAVHESVRACFAALAKDVEARFGTALTTVGAIGVSAMMHGYLPFDADGTQLAAFRTWRNTITGKAAEKLTALFGFAFFSQVPDALSVVGFAVILLAAFGMRRS